MLIGSGALFLRAAESIGGFSQDLLPAINIKVFEAYHSDDQIAGFLADTVVVCLNSDPASFNRKLSAHHRDHSGRSAPLASHYGFQNTADAYACYRGASLLREGRSFPISSQAMAFPGSKWTKRYSGTGNAAAIRSPVE